MSNENLKNYIHYMGVLIKEQARQAKQNEDKPKKGFEDYNKGIVMAYYTVISTLKNQAPFFDLKEEDIGLEDVNPELDLFAVHQKRNNDKT